MDANTKAFYATHAQRLGNLYSSGGDAADLRAIFRDCRKILDLGCGTGRDLAALLRAGKAAVGTDAVPGQGRNVIEAQKCFATLTRVPQLKKSGYYQSATYVF